MERLSGCGSRMARRLRIWGRSKMSDDDASDEYRIWNRHCFPKLTGRLLTYGKTPTDASPTISRTSSPPAPSLLGASTPHCSTTDSASLKTSPHGLTG